MSRYSSFQSYNIMFKISCNIYSIIIKVSH